MGVIGMFKKQGKGQRAEMWRVREGTLGGNFRKECREQITGDLVGHVDKVGFYVKYRGKPLEHFELMSE